MPPLLHKHLQKGLVFEALEPDPECALEAIADVHYDASQRAAKRRKIENIAAQYLRGRPPVLLSSSLRGPFKNWNNPWASRGMPTRQKHGRITRQSRGGEPHEATAITNLQKDGLQERSRGATEISHQIRSAEPSKAVKVGKRNSDGRDGQKAQVIVLNASILTENNDQSTATEYFSANLHQNSPQRNPESNPDWLKRPAMPSDVRREDRSNTSPTPSRHANMAVDALPELQIDPSKGLAPRAPLLSSVRKDHPAAGAPCMWSASAPMDISSPLRPLHNVQEHSKDPGHVFVAPVVPHMFRPETHKPPDLTRSNLHTTIRTTDYSSATAGSILDVPSKTSETVGSTSEHAQRRDDFHKESSSTLQTNRTKSSQLTPSRPQQTPTPAISPAELHVQDADQTVLGGYHSARGLSRLAAERAFPTNDITKRPPSREEIHRSAERCVAGPAARVKERRTNRRGSKAVHDHIASPAPASSTGFAYRRTAKVQRARTAKARAVPRMMTFDTSPAIQEGDPRRNPKEAEADVTKHRPDEESISNHGSARGSARPDIYEVIASETAVNEQGNDQGQQEDLRSSRQSNYSTQAAMMLAHLEFQEGTFPSISCNTPDTGDGQPDSNTPQHVAREASPAITPFHAFNKELDERQPTLPQESVLRGPPMSTQDLFNAASPFAFSTVKKPRRQLRSSLRFAVLPSEDQSNHEADLTNDPKSPTPSAERIPLKERNSHLSPLKWGGKGSQESILKARRLSSSGVLELPNLDFHTSLDDALDGEILDYAYGYVREQKDEGGKSGAGEERRVEVLRCTGS
ncbi:hypothetical protein BCR34DRAFT_604183 [Clohesyomyces aquaticus]|uniref:Uncharacterized protein n=1 Tax=Clohesyomyces aquaticus TaxID=1231657 RepID=A0A1Y1Z915_9PLEO|nr:hypothetical protein BCR34DRAFT_604183 [Clohesyomyces aquaticus]